LVFVLKHGDPCSDEVEKQKRTTAPKQNTTDEAVYQWYTQQRSVSIPVRGVELQAAAERFAQRLGEYDFKASTGWLFRFRNRHGTANRKICEESLSAENVSVQPFQEKFYNNFRSG
jgi:hypothetical protein